MSDNAYLVWLVAMAIATVTVLTVGTLIASGIIRVGRRQDGSADAAPLQDASQDAGRPGADAHATADADPGRQLASTRRAD